MANWSWEMVPWYRFIPYQTVPYCQVWLYFAFVTELSFVMITSELTVIHSCQIQRFLKVKLKLRLHIFGPKSYKNNHSASYVAGFTGFPDLDMYCATSPTSTYLSSLFLELRLHTTYRQQRKKNIVHTSSALEVLYNWFFSDTFLLTSSKMPV